MFDPHDIYGGLIKSFVFGGVIAISGCYFGFTTSGGAEGVGTATMKAVVACCVMILVADYFLAEVIFRILFAEPSIEARHDRDPETDKRFGDARSWTGSTSRSRPGECMVDPGPLGLREERAA